MSNKMYGVTLPIYGSVYVEVEASSEKEAIDTALRSEITLDDIESWEAVRKICEGNVCHASPNYADARVLEEESD